MGVDSIAPSVSNPSFVPTIADEFDAAPKAFRVVPITDVSRCSKPPERGLDLLDHLVGAQARRFGW